MALFIKPVSANVLPALTAATAQSIYVLLKTKDANMMFLEDNIPTEYTVQVEKEMRKLEAEYMSKVSGTYLLTASIPATYDDEGEVDTEVVPAVYFALTTKAALLKTMSSEILNLETLCSDIEDYYREYKEDRDFSEFVSLLTT